MKNYRYRRKVFTDPLPDDMWRMARAWLNRKQPDVVSISEFMENVSQSDGSLRTQCVLSIFYRVPTTRR